MIRKTFLYGLISISFLAICLLPEAHDAKNSATKKVSQKNVLIAVQKSEFKDAVISSISRAIGKEAIVKTVDLGKILDEKTENYQAIVLVNTCMAWSINGKIKKFLKNLSDAEKKKVILFTTVGGEDWEPKGTGVDCVTSASKMIKADAAAETITKKVHAIIK